VRPEVSAPVPAPEVPARPAPPPLPEPPAPVAGPAPIVPRPKSQCFVCGSPLQEGQCPKCRMTWVE